MKDVNSTVKDSLNSKPHRELLSGNAKEAFNVIFDGKTHEIIAMLEKIAKDFLSEDE